MRNPRIGSLFVLGALIAPLLLGAGGQHSEVPNSTFSSFEFSEEYDHAVRRTLFEDVTDTPYIRMLAKPSFAPEWMVFLLQPKGNVAAVHLVVAREQVWTGNRPRIRRTLQREAELPADLAEFLRAIWVDMLREVRYPTEPTLGYDGTTYHFTSFVLNWGNLEGQVWSPPDSSAAGQLVAIGNTLRRYTEAGEDERPHIATTIRELGWALKSSLGSECNRDAAKPN